MYKSVQDSDTNIRYIQSGLTGVDRVEYYEYISSILRIFKYNGEPVDAVYRVCVISDDNRLFEKKEMVNKTEAEKYLNYVCSLYGCETLVKSVELE